MAANGLAPSYDICGNSDDQHRFPYRDRSGISRVNFAWFEGHIPTNKCLSFWVCWHPMSKVVYTVNDIAFTLCWLLSEPNVWQFCNLSFTSSLYELICIDVSDNSCRIEVYKVNKLWSDRVTVASVFFRPFETIQTIWWACEAIL